MRDPRQHRVRTPVRVLQEGRGEGGCGARERLPLLTVGLVAPVEQVAQEFEVGGEETPIETLRDPVQGTADGGQGGADDRDGLLGQHGGLLIW